MANEEVNSRKSKQAIENKRRTINYIVIAALAALIVTVLFLAFGGRSDKGSDNGQAVSDTKTEQVGAPAESASGTSSNNTVTTPSETSTNTNTVNRPTITTPVNRPTNSNTVNRPDNYNTVSRPTNSSSVSRPSANGYGSSSSSSSSSSNNNGTYNGRTDVPHTTKMDVLNGTYKDEDDNSTTNGRRGGKRVR